MLQKGYECSADDLEYIQNINDNSINLDIDLLFKFLKEKCKKKDEEDPEHKEHKFQKESKPQELIWQMLLLAQT